MPRMPKVYSYSRFSTPEQSQGDSLRRQMEAGRKWAEQNGHVLDDKLTMLDQGVSAFRGSNIAADGALGGFLEAVRLGLVEEGSYLLIENLDRLSRLPHRRAVRLLEDIVDAGIIVVTLSDGQEYTRDRLDRDLSGLIMALLVAFRAHDESLRKSQRVAAAWGAKRDRVRAGEDQRLTRRAPAWLRPEGDGWAVDELRADIVRRAYRLTLEGYGEHRIAQIFNREGVATLGRASKWHRSSVAKLLRNPAVIGHLVPGHLDHSTGTRRRILEAPVTGAFPPIVGESDWLAVRALKDGRAPASRGRAGAAPVANVLAGLARCPVCGDAMTRVNKGSGGKAGRPKLVCTRAKAGAGCSYVSVPLHQVEEAIKRKWQELLTDVPAGGRGPELDERHRDLEGAIAATAERLHGLADALDAQPSRAAAARLAECERELDRLQSDLEVIDEDRRLSDGGLIRERAYGLSHVMRAHEADPSGGLEPINGRLRIMFEGVTVDYRSGDLAFRWRQGGETVVSYAHPGFRPE